jgi:hypothetical protein
MDRPSRILAHLKIHRRHVLTSADRMAKSIKLHAEVQAPSEASLALLERARTSQWLMSAPTLANGAKTHDRNIHA